MIMKMLKYMAAAFSLLAGAAAFATGPVMGWSSWNTYRVNISDSLIMSQADALVSLGLDTCGYRYINIDDGYFGPRDSEGQLTFNTLRFPGGMSPVVRHIHSLGLKAGIYSDAGLSTCGSFWDNDSVGRGVGLYGNEQADCKLFFDSLRFDFIKVDFCGGDIKQNHDSLQLSERERYTSIARSIAATGRPVRLNVCRWAFPGTWVSDIAGSWRISGDIAPHWRYVKGIVNRNMHLSAYASPGHYNDMDMLEVGRGMTADEDLTHFAMWCAMGSPLLIGCDLTTIAPATLDLLKNTELIALGRDTAQAQAYPVRIDADGSAVLVKDIHRPFGACRAVVMYNPTDSARLMAATLAEVDLAGPATLRDLTLRRDIPATADSVVALVPAHGCRIVAVNASKRLDRTVYEAEDAWINLFQCLDMKAETPRPVADSGCSAGMKVAALGAHPDNWLEWRRVHISTPGIYSLHIATTPQNEASLMVSIDGGEPQPLTVSPTNPVAAVSANLAEGIHTVRVLNPDAPVPPLDRLTLQLDTRL